MYDVEYFRDRGLEQKHYVWALQMLDLLEPEQILDYGCGRGPFVHAFRFYSACASGYDPFVPDDSVIGLARGAVRATKPVGKFELVMCFDVLEHLNEQEISAVIDEVIAYSSKNVLTSICYFDDPNFPRDATHKTARSEAWWESQFTRRGCKRIELPDNFMFRQQCMLFEVSNENEQQQQQQQSIVPVRK